MTEGRMSEVPGYGYGAPDTAHSPWPSTSDLPRTANGVRDLVVPKRRFAAPRAGRRPLLACTRGLRSLLGCCLIAELPCPCHV